MNVWINDEFGVFDEMQINITKMVVILTKNISKGVLEPAVFLLLIAVLTWNP